MFIIEYYKIVLKDNKITLEIIDDSYKYQDPDIKKYKKLFTKYISFFGKKFITDIFKDLDFQTKINQNVCNYDKLHYKYEGG